jgi:PQQ-dependent dehydrogenase (methanol/ethanol family)
MLRMSTSGRMRRATTLACALALVGACKREGKPAPDEGSIKPVPGALAGIRTISPLPAADWTLPGGDLANTRFSPLTQITTDNVKGLKVTATVTTGVPHGHEGQPLVVNNTMYVVTPYPDDLIAIDLAQPGTPIKWRFRPAPDPRSVGIACCDIVNRGASFADGLIIYNLLDAHTVAVDATTGQERWRTAIGNIDLGETITMAPLVVKNLVIVGNSGGELGVRGKIVALDLHTGHEVWRAFNTGPDAEALVGPAFRPFYDKDKAPDQGVTSWPPDQWKVGGATVWGWVSYDPELNLIYYGTSNPGVWNPDLRPGDNKWSASIIARNVDDGAARWAYQITAHDSWDYDEINESVLVDLEWGGRMRKVLLHAGRNGFLFVMDRETGEVLSADKFEPTNWASSYDLKTGLPVEDPSKRVHIGSVTRGICPSSTGAKEVAPTAFSPKTGLLYVPAHNTCMDYEGTEASYIAGTPYLGASVKMYPGPGGYQGELIGWDVVNRRKAWSVKEEKFPLNGGVLATAGDVVFYGTMDGWFKALDARSGTELWRSKLASGVVGNPMTFVGPDGKQYVAIYGGVGGWMGAVAFTDVSADDPYAALGVVGAMKDIKHYSEAGDVVYVFGL